MISETLNAILYFLEKTEGVEQSEIHHPEGDVLNHSLQVLEWAFRESDDIDLIIAAMLHDTGKAVKGYGHEKTILDLLSPHTSAKTLWLIEHHMRIWDYILGDMKKYSKCIYLATHPWLPELIQLARWDKLGRNPNKKMIYDKEMIAIKISDKAKLHFRGTN